MRKLIAALAAGASVVGIMHAAHAEGPWYVSGSLGALQKESQDGPSAVTFPSAPPLPDQRQESFDPGFIAGLAIGRQLPAGFRVEAELGYAYFKSDKINITSSNPTFNGDFPLAGGGDYNRYMATANAFYDLSLGWSFTPYLGIGVGAAHLTQSSTVYRNGAGVALRHNENSAEHPVVLAEVGVAIPLTTSWAVVPAYRYLRIVDGNQGSAGDEADHVLKLGLRYSF
jgi:opacity protein-like surface antigen